MVMHVKRRLWSLVHMVLPGVGLVLTCSGAYLYLQTGYTWRVILACIMMVLGFLAVITGVFLNMFHSMKSKIYRRGQEQHIQVYTIDRLSSFPPSYEESQGSQECYRSDITSEFVVVVDGVDVVVSLAPPLYSQDSSETPDCTWSWEQPPRYSQVERMQQGEVDEDEWTGALSRH